MERLYLFAARWREQFSGPAAVLILWLLVETYHGLTGRAPADDLGALVGFGVNNLVLAGAAMWTGWIKGHLFTDLSHEETKTLPGWRVLIDSGETLCVFFGSVYVLSH